MRADVLRAISDLEKARWAPRDWDDFRQGVSALWAAGLVANAPRGLISEYIQIAYVARRTSDTSWEEAPDPEHGGGIPTTLADLTREAAEMLVNHVWNPLRHRAFVESDLRKLRTKTDNAKAVLREAGDRVNWSEWNNF